MYSSRFRSPSSTARSAPSRSAVISALVSRGSSIRVRASINRTPRAVARRALRLLVPVHRSMYARLIRVSIMSARVAGVPNPPVSFKIRASSSSSSTRPAVSIIPRSCPSLIRPGGGFFEDLVTFVFDCTLPTVERRKRFSRVFFGLTIHRSPSGKFQDGLPGTERFFTDHRNSLDLGHDCGRVECREKAADNQIENLRLVPRQGTKTPLSRWNDREVIAHRFVVEVAFLILESTRFQCLDKRTVGLALAQIVQNSGNDTRVIFGQSLRIRSRVRQELVALVQPLCRLKRSSSGKAEPFVRLLLQGCQVKQRRSPRLLSFRVSVAVPSRVSSRVFTICFRRSSVRIRSTLPSLMDGSYQVASYVCPGPLNFP